MSTHENMTLTRAELDACRPINGEGGRTLRAYCPFHQSDKQRSLRIKLDTGRFQCFACEAWGYLDDARRVHQAPTTRYRPSAAGSTAPPKSPAPPEIKPGFPNIDRVLAEYQAALPGSWGELYLRRRGIPLDLAQRYGLGWSAPGRWAHPGRDWQAGRLVVPHTTPQGEVVNLYGRALEGRNLAPKHLRHDHLPGAKGYFNAAALSTESEPYICEGPFDALALLATGRPAVAIFGVSGWRWEWVRHLQHVIFAMDADETGERETRKLAHQAGVRGIHVRWLAPTVYGTHKDASAAWAAGSLTFQ